VAKPSTGEAPETFYLKVLAVFDEKAKHTKNTKKLEMSPILQVEGRLAGPWDLKSTSFVGLIISKNTLLPKKAKS
jgi:hypothetical protein